MIYHGIDLVDVARLKRSIDEHGSHFLDRVFSAEEQRYCDAQQKRRFEHYAARFAAKEAVFKALGTGWSGGIAWTDVQVQREPSGRPTMALSNVALQAAEELLIVHWVISLSHTETHAIGSVIGTTG